MENLIDKYHCEYIKCSKLLNQLTDELENMQKGKSANYHLMLAAITYLERYSELSLLSEKQIKCIKQPKSHRTNELNEIATLFYDEITDLKILTHKVRDYVDAAIGDCMFEKKPFECNLKRYIQGQREHLDTGEYVILPLLEEKISKMHNAEN
ncbi:MAG: hemerythrin-like domain-containing protein [Enterobacterales bacterium]|jgi:hemerythrin-like domain-containing protein